MHFRIHKRVKVVFALTIISAAGIAFVAQTGSAIGKSMNFKPISMRCPGQNNNVFELIQRNGEGGTTRSRAFYAGNKIVHQTLEAALPNGSFVLMNEGAPDPRTTDRNGMILLNLSKQTQTVMDSVCNSTDAQAQSRYREWLKQNYQSLISPQKAE